MLVCVLLLICVLSVACWQADAIEVSWFDARLLCTYNTCCWAGFAPLVLLQQNPQQAPVAALPRRLITDCQPNSGCCVFFTTLCSQDVSRSLCLVVVDAAAAV
jgi:hypothetical protein